MGVGRPSLMHRISKCVLMVRGGKGSIVDFIAMMDVEPPKPGPGGPYKKHGVSE
jgi:hypothetical protein